MEFGVVLPNLAMFGAALPGPRELIGYAAAAKEAGFRSVWAADHIMHKDPGYYAPAVLQAVATAVPEIKVGFAAMPAFLRHPLYAAKIIATLEALTEDRLEVAFSIGDERPEMVALGTDPSERGRRLDETLDVLFRLRDETAVTFKGRFYSFKEARIRPKPLQSHTQTFIASWTGLKSLGRIFRYGTGWMASGLFSTQEDLRNGMGALRAEAQRLGVAVPPTIITNVLLYIADDATKLERARTAVADPDGSLAGVRGVRLIGQPSLVQERLELIQSLGFERLNVLPLNFEMAQFTAFMNLASQI